MTELEYLITNLNLEEYSFFYHITGKGYGNDILENGLYLKEKTLESTTIPIDLQIIDDFVNYCINEYNNTIMKRQEMVIIWCEKGSEKDLISKTLVPLIQGTDKLNYFIKSENILGYIDLNNLNFIENPNSFFEIGGKHV